MRIHPKIRQTNDICIFRHNQAVTHYPRLVARHDGIRGSSRHFLANDECDTKCTCRLQMQTVVVFLQQTRPACNTRLALAVREYITPVVRAMIQDLSSPGKIEEGFEDNRGILLLF